MKKTIFSLLMASVLALTACQEKETAFPSLMVKSVPLMNKEQTFTANEKETATSQDESPRYSETFIDYQISSIETGYPWLDEILYQQIEANLDIPLDGADEHPQLEALKALKKLPTSKERVLKLLDISYQQDLEFVKNLEQLGAELSINTQYIGQRQHVATFIIDQYIFSGGAHGILGQNIINIDTQKKSKIQLADLIPTQNQAKFKEQLWKSYVEFNAQNSLNDENLFYTNKQDFEISPEFYFTVEGITFVYPPYAIAPFVAGIVELNIPWESVKSLINPAYTW